MNIGKIIQEIMLNSNLWGALFSTLFITGLGYWLRKSGKIKPETAKQLTTILLTVVLPALSFNAFMADFKKAEFIQGIWILVFSFIFYLTMIPLTKVLYAKQKGDKQLALRMLTIFGSTTFFGIPIISAVYGKLGTMLASIFNLAYRLFLYSYCLISMSPDEEKERVNLGELFKTVFGNPIIIATFTGLLFWVFQDVAPHVNVPTIVNGEVVKVSVSMLRIDQMLPWLGKGIATLGSLSSPLAWLAIGMTLAEINFAEAIKEKLVWLYSGYKLFLTPLIYLVVLIGFNVLLKVVGQPQLTETAFGVVMIFLATPPATVTVAYAINFDREAVLASNASVVSTLIAVFAITMWVIIVAACAVAGIIPVNI